MDIDITSCLNTVNTLKGYVSACFAKCTAKGSTYSGTNTLANLETAIDVIPTGSGSGGTISENINGASFELFTVTKPDEISPNEFTIDFGGVGVTWRSIICYSDTKDGHFSIHKLSNNKCVISASIFSFVKFFVFNFPLKNCSCINPGSIVFLSNNCFFNSM